MTSENPQFLPRASRPTPNQAPPPSKTTNPRRRRSAGAQSSTRSPPRRAEATSSGTRKTPDARPATPQGSARGVPGLVVSAGWECRLRNLGGRLGAEAARARVRSVWTGRRGRHSASSVPVGAAAAAARVLRAEGRREVGREERGRTGAGWAGPGSGSAAPTEASRQAAARPPRGRRALVSAGRRATQGPGLPRGPSPGVSAARGCTWARPRRRLTCSRAPGRREGAASSSRDSFLLFS